MDIDADALANCRLNLDEFAENEDLYNIDLVQMDIKQAMLVAHHPWIDKFDTVIMNPPFGTRNEG